MKHNPNINYANILDNVILVMRSLEKEYIELNVIYQKQKEYRKTPEGKLALKRANEKQLLKKMKDIGRIQCYKCREKKFEILNIYDGIISCYNCRYERPKVLEEDEICQ